MPIQKLFPTLLYRDALMARGVRQLNRDLVRESRIARDIDDDGREWSKAHYPGGYTSYASMNDLHRRFSTFEDLRREIDRHVRKFARALQWDLLGGELEMTSCWINVMPKGAFHSQHLHPLSVISGTYYALMPKGASALKVEDPRLSRFMGSPPRRDGAKRENQVHIEELAREGDLILFESWLRHEVPASRIERERISVSFNYDWTVKTKPR